MGRGFMFVLSAAKPLFRAQHKHEPGPVGVSVFPQGRIIAEYFGATLVGTGNRSGHLLTAIFRLDPENDF